MDFRPSRRFYNGVIMPDAPCPANVRRIDLGCLPQFVEMSRHGILVDTGQLAAVSAQLTERMRVIEADIAAAIRRPLKYDSKSGRPEIASPPKVAELLFRELHVQGDAPVRMTDSGAWEATGEGVLQLYRDNHPVIDMILEWRGCDKLDGTYCRPIPQMLDSDGRLHTTWKLTTAATGRVASEDPNIMNIPSRGEWGVPIRNAFRAGKGRLLMGGDLSQIEMVWCAVLAGQPRMLQTIREAGDLHRVNAADMNQIPESEVTKEQRSGAKTAGFGTLYLIGPQGLQAQLRELTGELHTESWCQDYLNQFYAARPEISRWQALQFQRARRYGMVWCPFGRIRRIPEVRSALNWVESSGLRQAANQPITAAAQATIKLAQAEIHPHQQRYTKRGVCWPLVQEHDALLFEIEPEMADEFGALCQVIMENAVELPVPVRSSMETAERWGELK